MTSLNHLGPAWTLSPIVLKSDTFRLTREERKKLTSVLLHAVSIGEEKVSILKAIDSVVVNIASYVLEDCEKVDLPSVLPTEIIKQIKE